MSATSDRLQMEAMSPPRDPSGGASTARLRLPSIDALRGLVMIIMALDHTREFFNASAQLFQPEDLSRTTVALFFTRWVTHICAPVFCFTAGLGAFFWMNHGRTPGQLSSFLWKRGIWLAIVDLTIMRFALTFSLLHGIVILNVLWMLGLSMIVMAGLVRLPVRALAIGSLLVIALHNLTDSVNATQFGPFAWVWNILHQQGVFKIGGALVLVAYPLVPWFAVMALGYCFGEVMRLPAERRQRVLMWIGLGAVVAFAVLRGINRYGDPQPWSRNFTGMTVLSFLRCTKYPASLDFLLMTMGPALLLLAWFDRLTFSRGNPLIVFGRVPFFYFVVHFYLIHLLTFPLALVHYRRAAFLLQPLPSVGGSADLYPPNYGYGLWTVYAVWAVVVIVMYPVCRWFAELKRRRYEWWLTYL
ncbi:MAG TPA: heparan-alpha-glucosaminide N-acetyltransferase domain-containing protein [Terriglobales bacterium]|nr:heparan-alpha-glucosaminide N-acetyltransferase domain-containing protein [Terriglobales bacterium]